MSPDSIGLVVLAVALLLAAWGTSKLIERRALLHWRNVHTAALGRNEVAADWCCICLVDLQPDDVWEKREHLDETGDELLGGGSWVARTYCGEHAPADALAPLRSDG